jgi:hypothetical protein
LGSLRASTLDKETAKILHNKGTLISIRYTHAKPRKLGTDITPSLGLLVAGYPDAIVIHCQGHQTPLCGFQLEAQRSPQFL